MIWWGGGVKKVVRGLLNRREAVHTSDKIAFLDQLAKARILFLIRKTGSRNNFSCDSELRFKPEFLREIAKEAMHVFN
jgi:hypothetical protein